jgi:putative RecB family exonuclease
MDLPREYISYSQIRLYQTCPKKYYYTYIEKIPTPIKDKIFLGIVFHSLVEYFFKEKISGQTPQQKKMVELFKEKFDTRQNEQEITWDDSPGKNRNRGIAFVKYFLRQVAPAVEPLMVEKELWADLPGIDVPLKGVIDLVETDFSITEFKTTTAKWSKARLKGSYLQVVIYRYLFEKCFDNVIKRLKFIIVYAKNPPPVKHQEISIKPKDVDCDYSQMLDIVRYVVENIKNGVFYKNENYSCAFCEFKDVCRNSNT